MTPKKSTARQDLRNALATSVGKAEEGDDRRFANAEHVLLGNSRPPQAPTEAVVKPVPAAPEEPRQKPTQAATTSGEGGAESLPESRQKVNRDTFSFPGDEFEKIHKMHGEALMAGIVTTNRSTIIRAAISLLSELPPEERLQAIREVKPVKKGPPPSTPCR